MMKKTMLISYSIPPSPTGTATVINNILMHFRSNELVIAGAKNYRRDTNLVGKDTPTIKYISWRTKPFRGAGLIRILLIPFSLCLCIFYYLVHKCNNIIAIYPNNEYLLMSFIVSKITGADFYPYLHNTFSDGKNRVGLKRTIFEYFEQLIFNSSKKVFLISDGLKHHYEKKYLNKIKFVTIRHAYVEKPTVPFSNLPDKCPIEFLMIGSVNESNKDATKRLFKAIGKLQSARVLLRSSTHNSILSKYGISSNCKVIPELTQNDLFTLINKSYALLLPHGFTGKLSEIEYKTIFPTKTIDYLFAGRPIIAYCPPDCFLYHFLKKFNCAYIITDYDEGIVVEELYKFIYDKQNHKQLVMNAKIAAKLFKGRDVCEKLKQELC